MNDLVSYDLQDGIARITLDDGKANVMGVRMLGTISSALDRAQADQAVVLISGRTGMFSGGFDLGVFKSTDTQEMLRMLEAGARLTEKLLAFPRPVVALCTGHAVAMGLFLLLSCDHRVGPDQGAKFQANEVQIGMTLPYFAIEVLRQRLAPAHLVSVASTAAPYNPQQALAAGLLDELAAPADLMQAGLQAARRLAGLNAEAFTATKQRLREPTLQALHKAIAQDLAQWSARFSKS